MESPLARNWRELDHIRAVSTRLPWSSSVREFRDAAGASWTVFRATPHTTPSKRDQFLPDTYRNGWLVFECGVERRRLAPVPEAWEELADSELEQLCVLADVVPARRGQGRATTDAAGPTAAPATAELRESTSDAESTTARAVRMQQLLAEVIDEVCDQPRAPSLDTGELIRVVETLAIAAQAAREAVALRRERHGNSR
jgi:hypothetical protein